MFEILKCGMNDGKGNGVHTAAISDKDAVYEEFHKKGLTI
jgi:hypothetical protein